ncbi:MAG: peptidase domain-containing protein [Methanospirillum sp.]
MLMIGMTSVISITGATDIQATNGYVVTPGYDQGKVDVASQYSGTIQQGQWIWNSKYLFMGVCQLPVDLNWGSSSDSLTLKVSAPDASLGPYHDGDDGRIDGRIYLVITKSSGLTPGTWYFGIFGERVAGVRGYTFNV